MSYVALRSLKVQKADGSLEIRSPGSPVPEAENWPSVDRWVRRGWIAPGTAEAVKQSSKAVGPRTVAVDPEGKRIKDVEAYKAGETARKKESVMAGEMPLTEETLAGLTKVQLIKLGEKYGVELAETERKDELVSKVIRASKGA